MFRHDKSLHQRQHELRRLERQARQLYQQWPVSQRLVKGLVQAMLVIASASLGYALGRLLHTEQAFWAAITAIGVTQQSFLDTRTSSRDQAIGAVIGGLAGLLALYLGGDHYLTDATALLLATMLCWLVKLNGAGRLGGITVTIVMMVPHTGPFWTVALTRIAEVTIGISAALAVTWMAGRIDRRWFHHPDLPD